MHRYLTADAIDALNVGERRVQRLGDEYAGRGRKRHNFRKPNRTEAIALSDTIVTRIDGTQYVIEAHRNVVRTRKIKSTTGAVEQRPHRKMAADMPAIGNIE